MDLSNIQPIFRRYENEGQAEKDLAKLSVYGGKQVNIISIYPKGSFIYVWFYYDRNKIGYKAPAVEASESAENVTKKVTKKKASKKVTKKKIN